MCAKKRERERGEGDRTDMNIIETIYIIRNSVFADTIDFNMTRDD